jgi:hypothetical protein
MFVEHVKGHMSYGEFSVFYRRWCITDYENDGITILFYGEMIFPLCHIDSYDHTYVGGDRESFGI